MLFSGLKPEISVWWEGDSENLVLYILFLSGAPRSDRYTHLSKAYAPPAADDSYPFFIHTIFPDDTAISGSRNKRHGSFKNETNKLL